MSVRVSPAPAKRVREREVDARVLLRSFRVEEGTSDPRGVHMCLFVDVRSHLNSFITLLLPEAVTIKLKTCLFDIRTCVK